MTMTETINYQGPLTGLNVIDFGHYYAGPMVAMMLADQGANVIRIVRPGHPELREQQYRLLNRNKKLLTLDLKTPEGKTQAQPLIEQADVLIENFRPGVMKRLGLDYASLKEKNPGLIYLSLPGFASADKDRAHIQAWEGVLGAAACGYTQLHLFRETLGFPPVYTRVPQCSTYGAIHGATAVMAAVVAKQAQGAGTVIEVPLVNAGVHAVALNFAGVDGPNWPLPQGLQFSPDDSPELQMEKLDKAMRGTGLGSKSYVCADGREIYISIYLTNRFADRFLDTLGIAKQVKREGFVTVGPWETGLDNDVGNAGALGPERKQRLTDLISEAMLTKTAEEWEELFAKAGVPAAVIRTRQEYLTLQPMIDSGVLVKQGEGTSRLTVPGRLCDVAGPKGSLIDGYREAATISMDEALQLFRGYVADKESPTVEPLKKGELLKGLKVLDLCNVVAGPTSSHTLAEYGADVIKAEAPDGVLPMFLPVSLELNQGKRSIITDLTTAPGREIFARLVRWADVVVHNVLDDTAKRLGVSQAQLQAINPNVVSCQLSGNGGTRRGGWENRPTFDNLIQGLNGLLAQYGTLKQPMWHGAISSADTIGGISMAFSCLLAVYQQRTTGVASEVRTSLIRATNHYQLPHMIAENGRTDWGEAQGQFTLGEHWWQRMYRCRDGWIYVGAHQDSANLLAETVLSKKAADGKEMEVAMAEHDCAHWLNKLSEADIACHRVMNAQDLRGHAKIRKVDNESADELSDGDLEVLCWENHPCGSPVTKLATECVVVGENRSWKRLAPAPRYGQHTVEILKELGYNDDEIEEFLRLNVSYKILRGMNSSYSYFFPPNQG